MHLAILKWAPSPQEGGSFDRNKKGLEIESTIQKGPEKKCTLTRTLTMV